MWRALGIETPNENPTGALDDFCDAFTVKCLLAARVHGNVTRLWRTP